MSGIIQNDAKERLLQRKEQMLTLCSVVDRIVNGESMYAVCEEKGLDYRVVNDFFRKRLRIFEELDTVAELPKVEFWGDKLIKAVFNTELVYQERDFKVFYERVKARLSEREFQILDTYYKNNATLGDVGKEFGISTERVRQIIHKGIRKIKTRDNLYLLMFGSYYLELSEEEKEKEQKIRIANIEEHRQKINSYNQEYETIVRGFVEERSERSKLYESEYETLCKRNAKATALLKGAELEPLNLVKVVKLEDTHISCRLYNVLRRVGVKTLNELECKTEAEVSNFRNMGAKSLFELKSVMEENGLTLKEDDKTTKYVPKRVREQRRYRQSEQLKLENKRSALKENQKYNKLKKFLNKVGVDYIDTLDDNDIELHNFKGYGQVVNFIHNHKVYTFGDMLKYLQKVDIDTLTYDECSYVEVMLNWVSI